MKSYTTESLLSCLKKGNVLPGDLVMVHSSLLALGQLKNHKLREVPATIGRCLLDAIGPKGTLVAPTFSFSFCRGEPFDRQNSPSEKMGLLSEWLRTQPNATRSKHPIQSVAAIGPLASDICEPDSPSAFDLGGSFDRMINLNAKLILLGTNFQAASIIHFSEQQCAVPYRYWKSFSGTYICSRNAQKKTYQMFVRNLEVSSQLIMLPIEKELITRNQIQRFSLGAGHVRFSSFTDLVAATNHCLTQDPWCLVAAQKK